MNIHGKVVKWVGRETHSSIIAIGVAYEYFHANYNNEHRFVVIRAFYVTGRHIFGNYPPNNIICRLPKNIPAKKHWKYWLKRNVSELTILGDVPEGYLV